MKHKGFTLIELMGVFVVLALILLMTIPQIMSSIKNSADQEIEQFKNTLYVAAENYIAEYDIKAPTTISVETLVKSGFLKSSLIDPTTNEKVGTKGAVRITKTDNKYSYSYNDIYDTDNLKLPETIEVGKTIVFCGRSWWVLYQDTNSVTLMLNGSAGAGIYGSTPYKNSTVKRNMENWLKRDSYLSELLALNKIVAENGNIVRLVRKSEIPANYTNNSYFPFWIDNATNANSWSVMLGLKNGKTKIFQGTIGKRTIYQNHSSSFRTSSVYWLDSEQGGDIYFNDNTNMTTLSGNYYYFKEKVLASSSMGTALKNQSFSHCGGTTVTVCNSASCKYASSSGCGSKYIYESLSNKSIHYIQVIKVKKN